MSDSFDAPEPSWATLVRHLDMLLAAFLAEHYQLHGIMPLPSTTSVMTLLEWAAKKMRKELADANPPG